MNDAFASITGRIRDFISLGCIGSSDHSALENHFNAIALDLHALQVDSVPIYRQFCRRKGELRQLKSWHDLPALPISAFKQAPVTSVPDRQRAHAFYSSGTSSEQRSCHYHDDASLGVYESSLLAGFRLGIPPLPAHARFLSLTPPRCIAPHSSLVHMLETVRGAFVESQSCFIGSVDPSGHWQVDMEKALVALTLCTREEIPVFLAGTAFNFVHLLDHLEATNERFRLAPTSRIMETGGYKGRSRALSRAELYGRIHEFLGLQQARIASEYGMCELSSQAYDNGEATPRAFRFPHWARFRVVSPEDGRVLPEGVPGLLQVVDIANVRSVLAIQTEDLAVSTPEGFELLGRLPEAQARGCSLMTA